jgi:hypothetical protein
MAIRLRTVKGVRVALCAVETDEQPDDVYLDDADHYALAAKFCQDFRNEDLPEYEREWSALATQKRRDAKEELEKWIAEKERILERAAWLESVILEHTGKRCGAVNTERFPDDLAIVLINDAGAQLPFWFLHDQCIDARDEAFVKSELDRMAAEGWRANEW